MQTLAWPMVPLLKEVKQQARKLIQVHSNIETILIKHLQQREGGLHNFNQGPKRWWILLIIVWCSFQRCYAKDNSHQIQAYWRRGHSLTTCNAATPATPHRLIRSFLPREPQILKITARGPQNGRRGLERCLPLGFRHFLQLWQNKFFDLSTPSMRKVDDGEQKREKREKNGVFSGHYVIASSLLPKRRPLECRTLMPKARVFQDTHG